MSKKFFAAIAVVVAHVLVITGILVGFGLTSGTQEGEGYEKFTGELERNITLRILENDTAIKQGYFKELIDAFNAKYAEYGIKAQDANMDQYSDLENDGPFGYGPDVLYQANDRIMRYAGGYHVQPLPIEQLECYSQIDERAWDAYKITVGGEDYFCGAPVNIQGPLLYYRKSLLPSPDILESWNSLYQFSIERQAQGNFGYMKSLLDPYFSAGYLFSYGGYIFGDNNTNASDIGLSKNGAEKGANVIRQLASSMDERCIDYTITPIAYSELAKEKFFATMTTPDVYTLFIDELVAAGFTRPQAIEELGVADIPKLPASGDLTEQSPELIPSRMMGGVNGYAISSYTKYPNASLAFVDFATSFEMMMRRNTLLGIVPARKDAATELGGLSQTINNNMKEGNIVVMPSIKAIAQFWSPAETFFADLANDPFRSGGSQKYTTLESMKAALERMDKQIYDAIHTLG